MDKAHIDSLLTQAGKFFNFSRGKDIATLRESIYQMFDESELLRHIDDKNTKLQFVGNVLNASSVDNEAFGKFVSLVENDYAAFANSVSLKEEVEAYTKLLALQKELARLLSLKAIANKSTIAVGGGFSAGKSQFVSSFFGDNTIALPIGVTPVTAIASYIVHGDRHIIKGYTYQNGVVDVPLDLYANLSHDFIKELGFNLKNILPMMVMETPIPAYQHICFIDTPGYNPSDSGFSGKDKDTAIEYLANANALIWLISAQAGTFPASDLAFLDSLDLEGKKLYILLNKADLKPQSELESILDHIQEVLDDNYMKYEGISAYDSRNKKELAHRKLSLHNFLHSVDKDIASKEQLKNELNGVFAMYENALEADKQRAKNIRSVISSLELDILESGVDFDEVGNDDFDENAKQEQVTDKIVMLQNLVDQLNQAIGEEDTDTDSLVTIIQDAIEYGDEDIIQGLIAQQMQTHTELSEKFKNSFTEFSSEERAAAKAMLDIAELSVDILTNGRYIGIEEPEEEKQDNTDENTEEGEETEELSGLMSERIALRFEELREFVGLAELDKQIKELHTLKGKMQKALDELIAEIFAS